MLQKIKWSLYTPHYKWEVAIRQIIDVYFKHYADVWHDEVACEVLEGFLENLIRVEDRCQSSFLCPTDRDFLEILRSVLTASTCFDLDHTTYVWSIVQGAITREMEA